MLTAPCWRVFWCDPLSDLGFRSDPVLTGLPTLSEFASAHGTLRGQPFLLRSDGMIDVDVNAFFGSPRMRSCRHGTLRKYAFELSTWMGFLDAVGASWRSATPDTVDAFKFWRMTDESNPSRVAGATMRSGLVALSAFYEWAHRRHGVDNPVLRVDVGAGQSSRGRAAPRGFRAGPHVVRDRDVKWLDPAGYRRWRDVGLRCLTVEGREIVASRSRNTQRDSAFADGLYGTGLRLTEWASMLDIELPAHDVMRGFSTGWLSAECAKGGRGRRYWVPRDAVNDVLSYVEGERAQAVRRARQGGRYEHVPSLRIVHRVLGGRRIETSGAGGDKSIVSLDALGPEERLHLFREDGDGLVPLALWLNEDGLPRRPHGWQHTFTAANVRVAGCGLTGLTATAHMLRHSFALRWFAVGRLLYEQRFAHLDADEMRDYRAQFGDTWYFVMTLLGHTDVATTMNTYLEPFRDLDVSLLIEHAHGAAMDNLLGELFQSHPLVTTDPLSTAGQS